MNPRLLLMLAAITGALGVMFGAFGAHGLPKFLDGVSAEEYEKRLDNFKTAADYHLLHALAMLATAAIASQRPAKLLTVASLSFLVGVAIFSGCLYAYSLTGIKVFGAIVPIGGVLLIVGWVVLGVFASKSQTE